MTKRAGSTARASLEHRKTSTKEANNGRSETTTRRGGARRDGSGAECADAANVAVRKKRRAAVAHEEADASLQRAPIRVGPRRRVATSASERTLKRPSRHGETLTTPRGARFRAIAYAGGLAWLWVSK